MQLDVRGPDAVAIYAASEMLKRIGYTFTALAASTAFLQWIFT